MIPATASRPCSTTSSQTAVTALSGPVRTRTRGLHALHISPQGLAHYAPGATLDHPAQTLAGFDGVRWGTELDDARPVRASVVSAWIFALGATVWALSRLWRRRK